jgi:tetratricopeptide (TPR) repeat protein
LWEVQSKKVAIQKRYDPELLSIILDLAALYRDWGLYPSAASQYRTALSYEEQAPTKRLLDIARDTNNLALVEHLSALASGELADRKLKFQESERLYQKALGIYRQTGSQPWSESIVLKNSALLARDAKGDWK